MKTFVRFVWAFIYMWQCSWMWGWTFFLSTQDWPLRTTISGYNWRCTL